MREDLLEVRSLAVNFYVLRDERGLYLIDGGFLGGRRSLKRALFRRGWQSEPILGIIVTHGHLDHILNVAKIAQETGAWVAAPEQDTRHYEGRPHYRGMSKVTGCLEAVGRSLLNFQPFTPTRPLSDGDFLDIWQGLKVIHLPGHTAGHIGLYCEKLQLLFSADLFASFGSLSHWPPHFLNADSGQVRKSARRALELPLKGVLPNHGNTTTPAEHLKRLQKLSRENQ